MSRISPAGLLMIAAALVPVAIEFPVVLTFVGIKDFSFAMSFGLFAFVFVLIVVWSEVSDLTGSSTKS